MLVIFGSLHNHPLNHVKKCTLMWLYRLSLAHRNDYYKTKYSNNFIKNIKIIIATLYRNINKLYYLCIKLK